MAPDVDVLDARLSKIESGLPAMRGRRRMSRVELAAALREAVAGGLSDADLERELAGVLPAAELAGLALRLRVSILKIADRLAGA